MLPKEVKSWSVQQGFDSEDYFFLFKNQLIKDLGDDEIHEILQGFSFNEVASFFNFCKSYFIRQFEYRPSVFSQQMYRVDLSESVIKLVFSGAAFSWEDVTNQILRRVLLKIVLRSYYKS